MQMSILEMNRSSDPRITKSLLPNSSGFNTVNKIPTWYPLKWSIGVSAIARWPSSYPCQVVALRGCTSIQSSQQSYSGAPSVRGFATRDTLGTRRTHFCCSCNNFHRPVVEHPWFVGKTVKFSYAYGGFFLLLGYQLKVRIHCFPLITVLTLLWKKRFWYLSVLLPNVF